MSQTQQTNLKPWVLTVTLKGSSKEYDPERFSQAVKELFNKWHTKGKFLWSGPLDDNKTALTVFEGTEEEAKNILEDYKKAIGDAVDIELRQWEALPILSLL